MNAPTTNPASEAPVLRATADGGFKGLLDRVLAWACVALMGASVLNVLWQVITRFVLGNPSAFTDELARFLLIWLGLLGAAYAVGQRMHLAIDLLPRALDEKPRARAALGVFLQASMLAFALGVMVYGGGNLVRLTTLLEQKSAALGLSLGAVYSVLPLAGGVIALYAALGVAGHVRGLTNPPPPREGSGLDELTAANRPDGPLSLEDAQRAAERREVIQREGTSNPIPPTDPGYRDPASGDTSNAR